MCSTGLSPALRLDVEPLHVVLDGGPEAYAGHGGEGLQAPDYDSLLPGRWRTHRGRRTSSVQEGSYERSCTAERLGPVSAKSLEASSEADKGLNGLSPFFILLKISTLIFEFSYFASDNSV